MSSDNFYNDGCDGHDQWKRMGVLAVEMEAAGLYMTAARCGKRALCLCTISDHHLPPRELTPEERERSMNDMIEIALDTAAENGQGLSVCSSSQIGRGKFTRDVVGFYLNDTANDGIIL